MSVFPATLDPHNPENANAGNGGDIVKHAALVAMVRYLVARPPWRDGQLRVRECHAGRGVYAIAEGDPRRRNTAFLATSASALAATGRAALARVGTRFEEGDYPGSSVLLHEATGGAGVHDAYEWDPATRAVLASVAGSAANWRVVGAPGVRVDGEGALARRVHAFDVRDLLVLDPFGLWHRPRHAFRRARFRRLFDRRARLESRPCVFAFFTWGQHEAAMRSALGADRCLFVETWGAPRAWRSPRGVDVGVVDGYRTLRALAGPLLRLRWHWDLHCVVWLAVPEAHLEPLRRDVANAVTELFRGAAPPEAGAELALVDGPRPARL
ncbi:MAG: hypothetical protein AAGN82_09865 [Myxococcota bacterium]